MALEVTKLRCGYDGQMIIHDVSLRVDDGGFATILGSNNAGKSTLINCISGIVPASGGSIMFDDVDITHMAPHRRVGLGVVQVPEGRQLFAGMTVLDNILMGAVGVRRAERQSSGADMERVLEMFPRLRDRRQQVAGSLSGGEQQMLAMARALMSRPRLLMLDEPSLGLAPLIVEGIFETMSALNDEGVTILLVEQNLTLSLKYAATGLVLDRGEVAIEGPSEALQASDETRRAYLGI